MTTADDATAAPEPLPPELMRQQISAECELAAALAAFQAQLQPAEALSLHAVVEAARPAFQLGFAYTASCSTDAEGQPVLEVTLLHSGGDQLSSQMRLPEADTLSGEGLFAAMARLLAQLLGIPVVPEAQHSKAEQGKKEEVGSQAESPAPAASVARAASATEAAAGSAVPAQQAGASGAAATPQDTAGSDRADRIGTHTPDSDDLGDPNPPVTGEALRPLSDEEREKLLEMVRAMRPLEARRQFQLAFRKHFQVPKETCSIAGFITQRRHRDFLDRFQQELRP